MITFQLIIMIKTATLAIEDILVTDCKGRWAEIVVLALLVILLVMMHGMDGAVMMGGMLQLKVVVVLVMAGTGRKEAGHGTTAGTVRVMAKVTVKIGLELRHRRCSWSQQPIQDLINTN